MTIEIIWESIEPIEDGLYWYDSNRRLACEPDERKPMLLQVHGNSKYVNGKGSCPLSSVYNEKMYNNKGISASFALIPKPHTKAKWKDLRSIKSDMSAWFRTPKGYMGVVINTRLGSHSGNGYSLCGDWIWLNHPNLGADYGAYVNENENYEYFIIDVPMVRIIK